jgi:hypothetical protein
MLPEGPKKSSFFLLLNEYKVLPSGIRAKTSEPPRVGDVKVWHKILKGALSLEVHFPTNASIGERLRIY